MPSITLPACAKLNLYLDITGKRPDGYHNIDSVMTAIDLADAVTVTAGGKGGNIRVKCDNPAIPADSRNIAYKAAELYFKESGLHNPPDIDIDIKKQIPVEAGLGGSSADGAAVLRALNGFYGNFDHARLLELGGALGSDLPFCLTGGTARVTGKGDIITPVETVYNVCYLVVKPAFSRNTREAYALYDACENFPPPEQEKPPRNVFQRLYKNAEIDGICGELTASGASGAAMTGSGSAVFGVFMDLKTAKAAFDRISAPFKRICKSA